MVRFLLHWVVRSFLLCSVSLYNCATPHTYQSAFYRHNKCLGHFGPMAGLHHRDKTAFPAWGKLEVPRGVRPKQVAIHDRWLGKNRWLAPDRGGTTRSGDGSDDASADCGAAGIADRAGCDDGQRPLQRLLGPDRPPGDKTTSRFLFFLPSDLSAGAQVVAASIRPEVTADSVNLVAGTPSNCCRLAIVAPNRPSSATISGKIWQRCTKSSSNRHHCTCSPMCTVPALERYRSCA